MTDNLGAAVQFAHIGIACSDQEATERFYTRYFGFHRVRTVDLGEEKLIFLADESCTFRLELFQATARHPFPPPSGDGPEWPALKHLAFSVPDLKSFLESMGEAAVITQNTVDLSSIIPGWKAVWLADPDGRIVEVSQGYLDENAV